MNIDFERESSRFILTLFSANQVLYINVDCLNVSWSKYQLNLKMNYNTWRRIEEVHFSIIWFCAQTPCVENWANFLNSNPKAEQSLVKEFGRVETKR